MGQRQITLLRLASLPPHDARRGVYWRELFRTAPNHSALDATVQNFVARQFLTSANYHETQLGPFGPDRLARAEASQAGRA